MKAVAYFFFLLSVRAAAPHYFLTTTAGYTPALTNPIALNQPAVAMLTAYDSTGALYYASQTHVWRLNANGTDSLIAGTLSSSATFTEGQPAIDAPISNLNDMKFDSFNNLYLADGGASKVYKVTPAGAMTTFAGTGVAQFKVLPATGPGVPAASVSVTPEALAIDPSDNVYVETILNAAVLGTCQGLLAFPPDGGSSILMVAPPASLVSDCNPHANLTVAGSKLFAVYAGPGISIGLPPAAGEAALAVPVNLGQYIATGANGNLYTFGLGLTEIDPTSFELEPLPNSSNVPIGSGLAVNPITGDVAVVYQGSVSVWTALFGQYQPVACAPPMFAGDNGPAALSVMAPGPLLADSAGDLYVADQSNNRIRKITPNGIITTIAGTGTAGATGDTGSALQAAIAPLDMAMDGAGNLYFINSVTSSFSPAVTSVTIRKIDHTGTITTVGGGGTGRLMNGSTAISVTIDPSHLACDSAGNLYFDNNKQLLELHTSGTVSIIAGTGSFGLITNGMPAINAGIGPISSIAVDRSGDVYIGDSQHDTIYEISGGNIQPVAGLNSLQAVLSNKLIPAGPANSLAIDIPNNIVVDSQGNLYFFAFSNGGGNNNPQVLLVDTSGNLTPIGGGGTAVGTSSGDGGDATLGTFVAIGGLAVDGSGNVYASDAGHQVREMSPFNPANPPPFVASGGVIGAGGSLPPVPAVSAGGEVSIFGANFVSAANAHTVGQGDLVNGVVPTVLAGVCASFGTTPAAILGVYPGQLNVQVGALPPGAVTVQVTTNCGTAQAVTSNFGGVAVQTASPEFYSFLPDPVAGHNPIAAVNALTGAFLGPPGLLPGATFVPAKPGDLVQAYATGFGATTPSYGLGVLPGAAGMVNAPYSLTLGGTLISPAYLGISPCCAGFYQVNFTVPPGTPSGALPLVISIAGVASPPEAYLQVQQP